MHAHVMLHAHPRSNACSCPCVHVFKGREGEAACIATTHGVASCCRCRCLIMTRMQAYMPALSASCEESPACFNKATGGFDGADHSSRQALARRSTTNAVAGGAHSRFKVGWDGCMHARVTCDFVHMRTHTIHTSLIKKTVMIVFFFFKAWCACCLLAHVLC